MTRLGWIRYLAWTLFIAVMLVIGLVLSADAQQGNMPKPVAILPAYPPVVCVTTTWKTESCENRQDGLPAYVVRDDTGGVIRDYVARYRIEKDRLFIIDGNCNSACTLVLANPHVCATAKGVFNFHAASNAETGMLSPSATAYLMNAYPETVQAWIKASGGLTKKWLTARATLFVDKCKEGV